MPNLFNSSKSKSYANHNNLMKKVNFSYRYNQNRHLSSIEYVPIKNFRLYPQHNISYSGYKLNFYPFSFNNLSINNQMNNRLIWIPSVSASIKHYSVKIHFQKWVGIQDLKDQHADLSKQLGTIQKQVHDSYQSIETRLKALEKTSQKENLHPTYTSETDSKTSDNKQRNNENKEEKKQKEEKTTVFHESYQKTMKSIKDLWFEPFIKTPSQIFSSLISLLIVYQLYLLFSSDQESSVDPEYLEDTDLAQELYKRFAAIAEISVMKGIITDKEGIFGVMLIGASGTGKSMALESLSDYYLRIARPGTRVLRLDCSSETYFQNQLIDIAKQWGMQLVVNCETNDYLQAKQYIAKNLSQNPGWLLLLDNVGIHFDWLISFLEELPSHGRQAGKFVISSQYSNVTTIKSTKLGFYPTIIDLNEGEYGFDEKHALNLFERITLNMYQEEELGWVRAALIKLPWINQHAPGFPYIDRSLKKQLIQQVGNSPQAAYSIAMFLKAEFKRTGKPPILLLGTYLEELKKELQSYSQNSIFQQPDYLKGTSKSRVDNREYEYLNRSVYKVALKKLDEIEKEGEPHEQHITKLAKDILPLCISLNSQYLDLKYVHAYCTQYKKLSATLSELMEAMDMLYDYGILKRYFPAKTSKNVRQYTRFHFHPSLRDAYLTLDAQRKKTTIDEQAKGIFKDVTSFIAKTFNLRSAYLKSEGLEWEYAAHCFTLLNTYRELFQAGTHTHIIHAFELIAPILNISIQAGYIKEEVLFYNAVKNAFIRSFEKNGLLPVCPVVEIDNNMEAISQQEKTGINNFCNSLAQIDKKLPAYYAEFIYYHARRHLKAALPAEELEICLQDMKLALAMRRIIDSDKSKYENVLDMNFDTRTFQRDGIGVFYLMEGSVPNLERAISFYDRVLQETQNDSNDHKKEISYSHCYTYRASLNAAKALLCWWRWASSSKK